MITVKAIARVGGSAVATSQGSIESREPQMRTVDDASLVYYVARARKKARASETVRKLKLDGDSLVYKGVVIPDQSEVFYPEWQGRRSEDYAIIYVGTKGASITIRRGKIKVKSAPSAFAARNLYG